MRPGAYLAFLDELLSRRLSWHLDLRTTSLFEKSIEASIVAQSVTNTKSGTNDRVERKSAGGKYLAGQLETLTEGGPSE